MTLPAFGIGRYPVTNAEYAAFVQAAGHAPAERSDQRHHHDTEDVGALETTQHRLETLRSSREHLQEDRQLHGLRQQLATEHPAHRLVKHLLHTRQERLHGLYETVPLIYQLVLKFG